MSDVLVKVVVFMRLKKNGSEDKEDSVVIEKVSMMIM